MGIQYLRAFAAIAVVCFHAAAKEKTDFLIGEAGVDAFFIISGFLMVAITKPQTDPWKFIIDRIVRIVPAYWIATAIMTAGIILGFFPNAKIEPRHAFYSLFFIPFISPSNGKIWPVLVPGWTLNYEMAFYCIFGALLWFSNEKYRVLFLNIILIILVLFGIMQNPNYVLMRFYTDQIMLEFAAGALLGLLWKQHREWLPGYRSTFFLAAIGFLLAWRSGGDANRALTFGVPAALLVAAVLSAERTKVIREWHIPALLGNASYSIYLWHTMAISLSSKVGHELHLSRGLLLAVEVTSGVVIGVIAYYLIEQPIKQGIARRRFSTSSARAVV